ncbi:uncharacterized protein LOC115709417 [Cannabis sativa]|uniref:uncharacterized protein LOC115709417 n=1 Tax=Cannabis sativa TaxID=3483 RepID=UPI0029CA7350|nr:uncharacterized protein LOC115709417 [Cannabis sativa]
MIWFCLGIVVGALVILAVEAYIVLLVLNRLSRKIKPKDQPVQLDPNQSLDFSNNKQGVVWVLESNKVAKDLIEQKRKKEFIEVYPVKKQAKIKDNSLVLTDSDGSSKTRIVNLKGCSIEAVSASNLSSRKWAKRFPIKLENKESAIYKDSKIVYIYLDTSWEKESWCRALRLASCDDKSKIDRLVMLQKEFRNYLTSLNVGYPSFMKPSAGFYAADLVDRTPKTEGASSKVRTLWKKIAKKASKGSGLENKSAWEKFHSYQDSVLGTSFVKNAPPVDTVKHSTEDTNSTSSTLSHSSSQNQNSAVSEADIDERLCIDEGTLCWNLLISRLFFDARKNEAMIKSLQARIQRTLSNMRTPAYIGEVICTNVNPGNIPPYIHGMRVLPTEMSEVWAFEVDIEYSGGAILGIETRLEVRELDPEKSTVDSNSVGDVSPDLLEGFEYYGKQLNLAEGTVDAAENKEDSDPKPDKLKSSKSSLSATTYGSRWKSIVNSIAKQVSEVPISLAIRVASLRGTLRVHIKPPPSDQLWFGFTSMPEIDFKLDSSVGEHKISNGHIALFLISRLKGSIHDTLVLPNCESVCIPWMLAEKDDWVPRKVSPFVWLNQESGNDSANANDVLNDQSPEEKLKTEANRGSFKGHSPGNNQTLKTVESVPCTNESLDIVSHPSTPTNPSNRTMNELTTPLLRIDETNGTEKGKDDKIPDSQFSSRSVSMSSSVEEDDSRPKRLGRRTRMLDLGKKMGEKLEEKRRHIEEKSKQIVEKMRGT